nr:immunoglobulin heavy chain junction region [Mus musculus]
CARAHYYGSSPFAYW